MKKLRGVSLIIPAHNSADVIVESINKYLKFLGSISHNYELIISCNACTDTTEELARKEAKKNKHVKVITTEKRGKGIAILSGFKIAKYDIVGFMDADCVFDLEKIKEMLFKINKFDCVIASKWLNRNVFKIPEPFTRKVLAVGWKALVILLLRMRFHDTQAGAKFLRRDVLKKINSNFVCTGFDFDVELLYKLKKQGFKVKEFYIPINKIYPFSTFHLKFIPGMFWRLFKLSLKKV